MAETFRNIFQNILKCFSIEINQQSRSWRSRKWLKWFAISIQLSIFVFEQLIRLKETDDWRGPTHDISTNSPIPSIGNFEIKIIDKSLKKESRGK